jgi:hypothetical protein
MVLAILLAFLLAVGWRSTAMLDLPAQPKPPSTKTLAPGVCRSTDTESK